MANQKGPKHVVVLYVINYTYLYHHIVLLDKYTNSNLDVHKIPQYQISRKPVQWGGGGADSCRRTDGHEEVNPLRPKDIYSGRTAPLTSKRFILYIYSTNVGNEYFKHCIYSPFFPLQNAVRFINLTYLVPVLFTFYIQGVGKI